MLRIAAAVLALAVCAAAVTDFEFVMQFTGGCTTAGTTQTCVAKANSQRITTTIDTNDAVHFDVKSSIGSYATWDAVATLYPNGSVAETGNFTFGIHLSRDHAIFYSSFGATGHTQPFDDQTVAFTVDGYITGGTGAFEGAQGVVSYSGQADTDFNEFTAFVAVISNEGAFARSKMLQVAAH